MAAGSRDPLCEASGHKISLLVLLDLSAIIARADCRGEGEPPLCIHSLMLRQRPTLRIQQTVARPSIRVLEGLEFSLQVACGNAGGLKIELALCQNVTTPGLTAKVE